MRILVIGGGGREHALAWKLSQSTFQNQVFAAPGNPGIAGIAECFPAPNPISAAALAENLSIDLTVVGPEAPLVAGIVDTFRERGLAILGPTAAAARLEGSKTFAKQTMRDLNIPTARFRAVKNIDEARQALAEFDYPVVLKADGLMAGKGVVIAHNQAEASDALHTLGSDLVIEEFLVGEEASFIALCDGKRGIPLEATQDHKQVFDGDTGPNTGGMGAYCDGRILTAEQVRDVMDRVVQPVIDRVGFSGFLYAGLMMTDAGPKVLEFNCRLGDPETQPLMHRLASDPAHAFLAAARGNLDGIQLEWKNDPSVCVVMAAAGYPGVPRVGDEIHGIDAAEATGATVFHAGTARPTGKLETKGGRVLGVTAAGTHLSAAIQNAYAAVEKIHFDGMHFRRDIGQKGLKRW